MARRALPGWAVDLAHNGLTPADLKRHGRHGINSAISRIALSAINAGHTFGDYCALLDDGTLGRQLRHHQPDKRVHDQLRRAWESAAAKNTRSPAKHAADATDVTTAVEHTRAWLNAADCPLHDDDRAVLTVWCAQATRYQTLTPVMPGREVATLAGLPHRTAVDALHRLARHGTLHIVDHGTHTATGTGRAARYTLGTPPE